MRLSAEKEKKLTEELFNINTISIVYGERYYATMRKQQEHRYKLTVSFQNLWQKFGLKVWIFLAPLQKNIIKKGIFFFFKSVFCKIW